MGAVIAELVLTNQIQVKAVALTNVTMESIQLLVRPNALIVGLARSRRSFRGAQPNVWIAPKGRTRTNPPIGFALIVPREKSPILLEVRHVKIALLVRVRKLEEASVHCARLVSILQSRGERANFALLADFRVPIKLNALLAVPASIWTRPGPTETANLALPESIKTR